jgi:hypothetical protein
MTTTVALPDELVAKLFLLIHPAEDSSAVPEKFKQIYSTIAPHAKPSEVPWAVVLPEALAEKFNKHLRLFSDTIQSLRDNSSYLKDVFIPTEQTLFSKTSLFQPAKIDERLFEQYLSEDTTGIVSSFEPGSDGYAQLPRYSRVSSGTGRLTVEHGPNILNLKKIYRNMLVSRWGDDGAILGLDYQSLEPSMLLALNNMAPSTMVPSSITYQREKEEERIGLVERTSRKGLVQSNGPIDPYIEIINRIGFKPTGTITKENLRSIIKPIVVSRMNGMQAQGLVRKIKEEIRAPLPTSPEQLVELVDEVLDLENINRKLYAEWTQKNGCKHIENYYGRYVECDTDTNLINRYFQSGAVDVAMLGFSNIIRYISESIPDPEEFISTTIAPLFLLHDMAIFDVNTSPGSSGLTTLNSFAKIGSNDLFGFADGSFKLRQSPFIYSQTTKQKK